MPLPVTLDALDCKNNIRHLNGTKNKILNNLHYNKTFTLLEDYYFQKQLEQVQTHVTVYQLNKMYTGTFGFMPADKNWIYDPTRKPYYNCPAHDHFGVNQVSWRLEVSEIEPTHDDTENVMIINGHTPLLSLLFGLALIFVYFIYYKTLLNERQKIKIDIGLKQSLLYIFHTQQNLRQQLALKVQQTLMYMYMLHLHKTQIILVFHVLKFF